jgi:hypothetical protein
MLDAAIACNNIPAARDRPEAVSSPKQTAYCEKHMHTQVNVMVCS